MTQVSRKGFVDKNGQKVVIVPNVPGATEGNLPHFDAEGNLQDSGKNTDSFAPAGHSHSVILDESTESSVSIEEGRISIFIEGEGSGGETEINANNIGNLHRALVTPSSIPENDAKKLITSKAVYDSLAGKAGRYNGTLIVDSNGNNSYPIPENGIVQKSLDSFVESAEQDKIYNVLVQFAPQNGYARFYPAIVYWEINDQDDIVVHIYVGDYNFQATKTQGSAMWEQLAFDRFKISTFLENF